MIRKFSIAALFIVCVFKLNAQTWADDVAPIIYQHCTTCHHTGGLAPTSFLTYSDVVSEMYPISGAVANGIMPPWPPDPTYNHLAHERLLSATEKANIIDWIMNGAPQGNMANAPTPPVYNNGAVITNPDLVVTIPTYTVDTTADVYRCFPLPSGISVQEFITQLEVIPGNPGIVHHVLVFADTSNVCYSLDAAAPGPGYTDFGGVGTESAYLVGTWVPGSQPQFLPAGCGYGLLPNSNIILQVHYPAGSLGQADSTQVRFKFATTTVRPVYDDIWLYHDYNMTDGPLVIQPNQVKTFHESQMVPFAMTLLDVFPHMHLIGTSIKVYAVTLQGDTIKLININDWDFHWQGAYPFRKAIKIPAYSTLYSEAVYDNTMSNPHQPNNPPALVTAGEATTDEMMLTFFSWMNYHVGDENIVIDSSAITSTNDWLIAVDGKNKIDCYPVPAAKQLHITINSNGSDEGQLVVTDLAGRTISMINANQKLVEGSNEIVADISALASGNYFITYKGLSQQLTRQFVKD